MSLKYSFMSFSYPEMTLPELLGTARRFGFDGLEPRIMAGHRHGVELTMPAEARRAARAQFAEAGIACACIATSCVFADPAKRAAQLDDLRGAIDLAGDVGAACVRVFGGQIPAGITRGTAIVEVAEALASVAAQAAARGVSVCLETHDDWCDAAHVAEVVRLANHPAIAVNWDIMHPVRLGLATMDSAFTLLAPWIRHLHVHDGRGDAHTLELLPIGTGDYDHHRAISLLRDHGYTGFISGEWIGYGDADLYLPRELSTMKGYEEAESM